KDGLDFLDTDAVVFHYVALNPFRMHNNRVRRATSRRQDALTPLKIGFTEELRIMDMLQVMRIENSRERRCDKLLIRKMDHAATKVFIEAIRLRDPSPAVPIPRNPGPCVPRRSY